MANSNYLRYLPPVLWVKETDPQQMLGRHLRIYERLLTGFSAKGMVVRDAAPFAWAQADVVTLADAADGARFMPGDWITLEGTAERRQVLAISGVTIDLDASLVGTYLLGGTVRIADLAPGQTSFRASNTGGVGSAYPITLLQSGATEDAMVAQVQDDFLLLQYGLSGTYSLAMDAVPVKLSDRLPDTHADFETQIDALATAFDPWRTRADFLPWLASWVALPLRPEWNEYQRRKLIAEMSGIYQQRGLRSGLYNYLGIYAVSATRPRMTVDDGAALFHARFGGDGMADLIPFAHSNSVSPVSDATKTLSVLLHPTGLAADSGNHLFVCDAADISLSEPRRPALWRVTSTGEVDYGPMAPLPMPMPTPVFSGLPFHLPCAVSVDATDRVAVLDSGNITGALTHRGAIYRFAPPGYALTTVIDEGTAPAFPAIHPVDMVLDAAGAFVVLDRGRHPLGSPPAGAANPQIVVVTEGPLAAAVHALPGVEEPTAILAEPGGTFLVTDARSQLVSTAPADIWRVDPAAGWTVTSLLGAIAPADNPLVFPTGLLFETSGVLLVCDTGVRWGFVGDPSNRIMSEAPRLYRIDLTAAPPVVTPVSGGQALVSPTKLARDRMGRIVIADRGEVMTDPPQRNWRAGSNEFGITILFSNQRPTTAAERNAFRRGIVPLIDEEMAVHTSWWMDF